MERIKQPKGKSAVKDTIVSDNVMSVFKNHINKHEYSQTEIALLIGISQGAISNYLAGKRDMPLQTFLNFCNVFNWTPEQAMKMARKERDFSETLKGRFFS